MKANLNERNRWRWYPETRLCPVIWCAPFGVLLIMPTTQKVHPEDAWRFADSGRFEGLPRDAGNPENVGYLGHRLVSIDYGAVGEPPIPPTSSGCGVV